MGAKSRVAVHPSADFMPKAKRKTQRKRTQPYASPSLHYDTPRANAIARAHRASGESAPEASVLTDTKLLEFTLRYYGVDRELMAAVCSGKSTARTRLDNHIKSKGYESYAAFLDECYRKGSIYYTENREYCSAFLSFHDFEAAVEIAEELRFYEERGELEASK